MSMRSGARGRVEARSVGEGKKGGGGRVWRWRVKSKTENKRRLRAAQIARVAPSEEMWAYSGTNRGWSAVGAAVSKGGNYRVRLPLKSSVNPVRPAVERKQVPMPDHAHTGHIFLHGGHRRTRP